MRPEKTVSLIFKEADASSSGVQQQLEKIEKSQGTPWHIKEQFALLVESVSEYAIFLLDTQGKIVSWNQGAERIKGYKAEEIIGRHFSCFHTPQDRENNLPEKALRAAARDGRYEMEGWRVRKDGSRFWADVVMTALYNPQGELIAFSKITRDLTDRLQKEQTLRASQESLRRLSLRLLHAQDEERRRIGRDLHDGVGQYLAMLKMHLDSLRSRPPSKESLDQKLDGCIQLAEEALKEVRTTSYQLSPPMLEECGLASAVPWYLEGFMDRSGIQTTCDISDFERLPHEEEIAIFRVLQESLTNVRRHSGSTTANIQLHRNEDKVWLEVRDEGKGIPPEILDAFNQESPGKLGVGLRSMKERIRQLGGSFEVISGEQGTIVRASVPAGIPPASLVDL